MSRKAFLVFLCFSCVLARPKNGFLSDLDSANTCGFASCPKVDPGKINIHLVPHTHDDVGWLKTVDQYYYGSKTMTQKAGVQYILDSVVQELLKDANRRFIYVESAFFFKWWQEQSPELQGKVKGLVKEGRLEFIGGAWSMNDEATTHYHSLIDQFAWGLKKLNDTFGMCGRPRVGWQIDPFGHSREMASIFAGMGFDGLFFARLDYEDKKKRLQTKTPEMVWHSSANLGKAADLFTGILYNHYSAPPGFCFDVLCSDEPIIDGKHSPDNNVLERIDAFLNYIRKMAQYYRTNNLMLPMGDDFTYQDANMWYKNLDKLIKYGNNKKVNESEINIFYSTPSCYLKSLHDANIKWPGKKEDFFPYSSDPHAFWTGYFTSRPTLKRFERVGNHFLQVCKQVSVLSPARDLSLDAKLDALREAMGIMQHHDAITGTEKQAVAVDYAKQLYEAVESCSSRTKDNLKSLLSSGVEPSEQQQFESCFNLNISECSVSENSEKFVVTLYNPVSHPVSEYVRVPVPEGNYEVRDQNNSLIASQIVPIPSSVKHLPFRFSTAQNELVFQAKNIPQHGLVSFSIQKTSDNKDPVVTLVRRGRELDKGATTTIGNAQIRLTFNDDGFLSNIYTGAAGSHEFHQEFLYYEGAVGNNLEFVNRSSGAYIFRPNNTERSVTQKVEIQAYRGAMVEEVHQKFNSWISQVVRVYKDQSYVEFEWLVGPIPVEEDKIGKEIISRFKSPIKSAGTFYTDSNGREMIKRVRNKRETFEPHLEELVSGNYYPITTKISLEDSGSRMSLLTDRAQGGSSLQDGSLELMLHRRLLHDDAFGVGEALDEKAFGRGLVARGKYYLVYGRPNGETKTRERSIQLKTTLPPWPFFSPAQQQTPQKLYLLPALPENVNILTLEPWGNGRTLIRFENILENSDVVEGSGVVRVDVQYTLMALKATGMRETTLDGNQWLSDMKRLEFMSEDEFDNGVHTDNSDDFPNSYFITLTPMQIRTFIVFN